jgi:hypothetical protein
VNAILAIIADGRRAIVVIYREGNRNKSISPLLYNFILNPSMAASSNPFRRGSGGWGTLIHQNHGAGGGNGSIMVGMFVCLCLVSIKPSEREFFVPAGTDLSVKLLRVCESHDFYENHHIHIHFEKYLTRDLRQFTFFK